MKQGFSCKTCKLTKKQQKKPMKTSYVESCPGRTGSGHGKANAMDACELVQAGKPASEGLARVYN